MKRKDCRRQEVDQQDQFVDEKLCAQQFISQFVRHQCLYQEALGHLAVHVGCKITIAKIPILVSLPKMFIHTSKFPSKRQF